MICIWICHFWSDRFLPVISSILELLNDNSCIERSNKVKMWTCHLWIRTRLTAAFWGHFFPPEMINLALSRWVNVSVNSCHLWNPCGGSDGNMAGRRPPQLVTPHLFIHATGFKKIFGLFWRSKKVAQICLPKFCRPPSFAAPFFLVFRLPKWIRVAILISNHMLASTFPSGFGLKGRLYFITPILRKNPWSLGFWNPIHLSSW